MLNRKVQLAFGSAIAILLVVGSISYQSIVMSSESNHWVWHTHGVLNSLEKLVSGMATAESSYRGFVLTGDESALESYRVSILLAKENEAELRTLTKDNPKQQLQLPVLEELMAQKIRLGDVLINLRRTKDAKAAADAVRSGPGQRIMDEFRGVVRKMQDEELRLLALRNTDAKRRLTQTKVVLLFGTVLGVLIAAGASWVVSHDIIARGLAEEALREGEERFRNLANNISQLAWMADDKGSIFWYNQRWFDYSGTTLEEMAGRGWQKVHHPDHVQAVVDKINRCFQNGEVWEDTFPLRGQDGNYRWFLSRAVPIRDSEGKILRWFGTNTDISAHKEAEKHLAQMEARYRGLLEAAPDAMVVVNPSGEIVLLNVQAEKQFGYSRDELVGQKVKNIIPDGFAERLVADGTRSAADALTQQIGTGIELSGRRKDGSEFPLEIMLSPLESPEGILVTAAIRNITEKKLAQEETQQQQHLLQLIVESIADGVVVADCSGKFLLFNTAAKRCLGIGVTNTDPDRWSEQYGTYLPDAVTPYPSDDLPLVRALRGENVNSTEVFIRNAEVPDGRLLDITGGPLRDEGGALRGGVVVFHDITERKKSEQHLVKTVGELKRSNEELQQFAYVSSHDLQEPLRMVASYTQLLARRYKGRLDSDADEFIAFAVDGCNRMQGLIQDLLAYSRAGTIGKALCDVSGEEALQGALTNLRITIGQSGAVVTHDSLPALRTDETQLTQVFQNLVGNAIKYRSAEAPRVHVSAAKNDDNEWIFSVRDNGLGIAPQYFERIFILFQRLHGRNEFEGTGIGLAICKKVLERLGGRIWVESQPEMGSTFYFALPERVGNL